VEQDDLVDVSTALLSVEDVGLVDTVLGWHWHEWSAGYADADRDSWRERLCSRTRSDGIPFTLVAWTDDRPVGCLTVCWDDLDERYASHGPWLSGMLVIGPARNLGVGRRLLDDAAARAHDFGATALWLRTGEASQFYERCGYHVVHSKEAIGDHAVLTRLLPS
jgi:GNAT superfamily N-acetyltransferase